MQTKKILKNANLAILIGLLVVTISFIISIVPCKKEAGVGVCRLPNPFLELPPSVQKYYFVSTNPLTAIVLQFLIPCTIVFLITFFEKRAEQKERILDYTKK